MTKLKLKKHLAVLPKEDVMNLVLSLYDASAEAKMYLEMYLTPDYSAALEKYKKIIFSLTNSDPFRLFLFL